MKRKIIQECPVYKNRDDIIDSWLLGKLDEKSRIGTAKVSMEEINVSVAYGYNVDKYGEMVVNVPQAELIKILFVPVHYFERDYGGKTNGVIKTNESYICCRF